MDDAPVFTEDELYDFVDQISRGRHKTMQQTNTLFARDFVYPCTKGVINKTTTQAVIDKITTKYPSFSSRRKGLGFFKRFLNHLNDTKEVNLTPFIKQIELFKVRKPRQINQDIIVDEDIKNLVNHIKDGKDSITNPENAIIFVYFGAYTGMRQATSDRLTVKHIKDALSLSPTPCIFVNHEIDKTDTEHYVPLHPRLIPLLTKLIEGKEDNDTIFGSSKLATYLKNHRLYQMNIPTKYVFVKHLRKYFIQKSNEIGLKEDYRDYIVSNQMNSVQWQHYKNFTHKQIYEGYIRSWGSVKFVDEEEIEEVLTTLEVSLDPEKEFERLRYLTKEVEAMDPVDPEENWEKTQQLQIEELERREFLVYNIQEMKEELIDLLNEKNLMISNFDEVLMDDEYFNKRLNKAEIPKRPLEPEIIIERLQYLIKEMMSIDPDHHDGKIWDFFQVQKQNEEDYRNYLIKYKIPKMKEDLEELAAEKNIPLPLDEVLRDDRYFDEKLKRQGL
jgi:integrase